MQARVRLVVDKSCTRKRADGLRPEAVCGCCKGLLDARVAEQGRDARRLLLCRLLLGRLRAEGAEVLLEASLRVASGSPGQPASPTRFCANFTRLLLQGEIT